MGIVAVGDQIVHRGGDCSSEVEQNVGEITVGDFPHLLVGFQNAFEVSSEREQHEHVDQQVNVVAVNEDMAQYTVSFAVVSHAVGDHGQFFEQGRVAEAAGRDDNRDKNQNKSHGGIRVSGYSIMIFRSSSWSSSPSLACPVFIPLLLRSYSRNRPRMANTLWLG